MNADKLRAREDPEMEPDKRLMPPGCTDDFPLADEEVERGQKNWERTTAGHDDNTNRSC